MLRWNGGVRNRAAAAGLAVLLLGSVVGCGKSATPAPKTAGPGTAASSASSGTAVGSGPLVPGAKLAAIDLPDPHGAPPKGDWVDATAIEDGDRRANYMAANDLWVGVDFFDCNLPRMKEDAQKPDSEGHLCVTDSTEKINGYPLYKPSDIARAVKLGHLFLLAVVGGTVMDKLTTNDLEAFLASIDLASIAAVVP